MATTIAEQLSAEQRAVLAASVQGPDTGLVEFDAAVQAEKAAATDVEKAIDLSVQRRVEAVGAASYPPVWWFTQPREWGVSPWWSPTRDKELREFVKKEGNDILAGAVSSMTKKFRAMNWVVDGPAATVQWAQDLLGQAEFGKGWSTFVGKTVEDYIECDAGAFWEVIGKGDPDKPLDGLPVGVAHLDSNLCQLTGDPSFPVVFLGAKDGRARKMHATRVVHLVDMESPNDSMNGIGFSSVSRVIASSELLLALSKYKREKLDDLPQAGLLVLNNVVPQKWEDAKAEYERGRRQLGHELWANIMTLIGVDPAQPADAKFISFANLPDHFDEQATITTYINIVALAMGIESREFWPVSSGVFGGSVESLVQHQKAKGKGIGDLISTIERAINWHLLPKRVTWSFDFQDDEEDRQRAEMDQIRIDSIMKMYAPDPSGSEMVATRLEVRQMLADNVDYFPESFLEVDMSEETEATDTDRDGDT